MAMRDGKVSDPVAQMRARSRASAPSWCPIAIAQLVADLAETPDPGKGEALVARLGGDEFVLLLPSSARSAAVAIRDRLRAVTVQLANGDMITASGSVGITSVSEQNSIDDALAASDSRMYRQKTRSSSTVTAR